MYTTDLIHSAYVKLNTKVNFQHVAFKLSVDSVFLLSGRLFLNIYVFNDICCRLQLANIVVLRPPKNKKIVIVLFWRKRWVGWAEI